MFALVIFGFLLMSYGTAFQQSEVIVLGGNEPRASFQTDREVTLIKRCRYIQFSRPYSMLQARCGDLGFGEIPKNLRVDTQILDFSVNRLRALKNDTFAAFPNLVSLYLQDNFIQTIEEGAFSRLRYLELVNLTKNGCQDFPKSTMRIPHLKKLILSENMISDSSIESTPALEEESSLEFLDLSKNRLHKVPALGNLPTLKYLNLAGNMITSVKSVDIAPFCSLEVLELTGNPITFAAGTCECHDFNAWIVSHNVKMNPPKFDCGGPEKENPGNCTVISGSNLVTAENLQFPNETLSVYKSCRKVIETRAQTAKARSTWVIVASCVGVSLVLLFLALCCIHKRNNRKKVRQRLKEQQITSNNANTELLNSNTLAAQT